MYAAHPALLVLALLSTKRPDIPKSHSFTPPVSSKRILLGLTSLWITPCFSFRYDKAFTVYYNKRNDNYQNRISSFIINLIHTATVTFPKKSSGIACLLLFRSLSKHVTINSMQIQTSDSVIKQPRHCTMYGQS